MSPLDHIFLYLFLCFLCLIYEESNRQLLFRSNKLTRNNTVYFYWALFFTYVFIEGLRYGRGVDQMNYGPFYLKWCFKPEEYFQEFETLFVWLNQLVYRLDIFKGIFPYGSIFIVYAAIFIFCFLKFYDNYKNEVRCFIFLGLVATLYLTEWTIRQGVGMSFLLLGLHYLEKGHCKWAAFYGLICCLIHHGNTIAVLLLFSMYYFYNKKPLPWKIMIPIFVSLEYMLQTDRIAEMLSSIGLFLDLSTNNIQGGQYLDEDVIQRELDATTEMQRGFFSQLITVLFYSALIYIGNKFHSIKPKGVYIYNVFVISIILFDPFRLMGSVFRVFIPTSTLWFVSLSLAFANIKILRCRSIFIMISLWIVILYMLVYYGRFVFFNPKAAYVWS